MCLKCRLPVKIIFFNTWQINTDKPLGYMADFSQGPADGTPIPRPARHAILGQHPRVGRFATWRETELEKRNSSSQWHVGLSEIADLHISYGQFNRENNDHPCAVGVPMLQDWWLKNQHDQFSGSIGVSFLEVLNQTATGWWFGTCFFNEYPYIGNVIIPTD